MISDGTNNEKMKGVLFSPEPRAGEQLKLAEFTPKQAFL